jgi:alkylated DNA repair protein (DNA oxidative demethylase)
MLTSQFELQWAELPVAAPEQLAVAPGVCLLRRFVPSAALLQQVEVLTARAALRHLTTPGGGRMSVAMTNCGSWGWHSDRSGYRYVQTDPLSGQAWPAMPPLFSEIAATAARVAGFEGFEPDCCLINRYELGAQMGAHRDFDEHDFRHPIVSVSLGVPAVFLWHGERRNDKPLVLRLEDGDVLVWGGEARAGYHAVRKLRAAVHPRAGALRFNLTFRRAH